MVTNQEAVTLEQIGSEITITGKLADLVSFASSNPAQGEHKWIGIDIKTNLKSIVGATWNGSELTAADAEEAAGLGLGAGHIVYWAKADVISENPASITIGLEGKESIELSVSFVEAE